MKWYLIIFLICIFLIAWPYFDLIFISWPYFVFLLAICISLKRWLFRSFAHFFRWVIYQFSSVAQLWSLQPHESQHARSPCPTPTPGIHSNSCPSSRWCPPAISSSVVPFSSCSQSLPASGSFPMSQLFASGAQSIGVSASASVLPMNTQDWCPLGWTDWISLQSKGLSKVFNTTVQKHQFFGAQLYIIPQIWGNYASTLSI